MGGRRWKTRQSARVIEGLLEKLWPPDKTDLRFKIRTQFDCPRVGEPAEMVLEFGPLSWGPCRLLAPPQIRQQVSSFTGPLSRA